jgi:hypothetical protein
MQTSLADRQSQYATAQVRPNYSAAGPIHDFSKPRYSIDNAKRRITEFEATSAAFSKGHPYTFVTDLDGDGVDKVYKIKLAEPMPRALPGIAFDAVHSLRAALDQSAYACAMAASPKKIPIRAQFPFGDIAALSMQTDSARDLSKDIPREILHLMLSFEPHKGGDGVLWALNELCNTDIQNIVAPACICIGGKMAETIAINGPMSFFLPRWDRAKHEMILARGTETFTRHNLQIATVIEIGHVDVVEGEPALEVLTYLHGRVTEIVDAVEAEASRIGLISQ